MSANWFAALMLLGVAWWPSNANAAGDIDVMKAGREDIGAFDNMLAQSKDTRKAPAARAAFGNTVTSEARKLKEQRERDLDGRSMGDQLSSQKRPDKKGSAASGTAPSDGSGQSARDKAPPGKGGGGSHGNGSGNAHGNGH